MFAPPQIKVRQRVACSRRACWGLVAAWASSIILHGIALAVLAYTHSTGDRLASAGHEQSADLTVTLVARMEDRHHGLFYEDPESNGWRTARLVTAHEVLDDGSKLATQATVAVPAVQQQPEMRTGLGSDRADPNAQAGLGTAVATGDELPGNDGALHLFGVASSGARCVYVFDRSASMAGSSRSLGVAKDELLTSLGRLSPAHRFQIVFYNQEQVTFPPANIPGMLPATPANLHRATAFIRGVLPDGSTNHASALLYALRQFPDAIYLLTDAEPALSDDQLALIRRANAHGTTIHTIEFRRGGMPAAENFLVKLAHQNGGVHTCIDPTMAPGRLTSDAPAPWR